MIYLLPPFSALLPAAINPKTPASGPLCQESWTTSLRWGPPSARAFILPLPQISPYHLYAKILFILHYPARLSFLWSLSLPSWTKLPFIFHSLCWTLKKEKKSIKYINIIIIFVVIRCMCMSRNWTDKLFKGQRQKLIHPFILTQCLAHKMDSGKVCAWKMESISDLPTWTKDKDSTWKE